jgi:integrase
MASILKRCDCPESAWRRCKHSWVVRYKADGKQREKSYLHDQKGLANDFALKVEHDKRAGVFETEDATTKFGEYAETVIRQGRIAASSRLIYSRVLRNHLTPLHNRTLRSVANDRDGIKTLILDDFPAKGASASSQRLALAVITSTLNEAVRSGKIREHRIRDIRISAAPSKAQFYAPTHGETERLSLEMGELGLTIWLMRGCGLRIQEALAVKKESFLEEGAVLRVSEQSARNGREVAPLKHRKTGEHRDVPVPAYVWAMIRDLPDGYLFRQDDGTLPQYQKALNRFGKAREAAGIPDGFTPHSLRHVFASVCLANGVPITDVAKWLGHRNINVTYSIYGHLVPSAVGRARQVLDEEWSA